MSTYLKSMVFIFISLILYSFVVYYSNVDSLIFLFTNSIIAVICIFSLTLLPNETYSLKNIFFLFTFFFMCCSPLIEIGQGVLYWGGGYISLDSYIMSNLLILIFVLLFLFSYILFKSRNYSFSIAEHFDKKFKVTIDGNSTGFYLVTIILSIIVSYLILSFNDFNIISMLFRGGVFERAELSQSFWLIYMYFIRPMLVFVLLMFSIREKKSHIFFTFMIIMVLLHLSPTSMARFLFVALYLPLIIVYTRVFNFKYSFSLYFITGLLLIFPLLDKFRLYDPGKDIKFAINFDFLTHGHFDAYQNLTRSIQSDFVTWGEQLLGSIYFFIPRSIWPSKPIGSGATLSQLESLDFSNISMPFIAESFINFHMIGVVIFSIVCGGGAAYLDSFYWKSQNKSGVTKLFYLFSLGMFLFILRGDLLSSLSYTISLMLSLTFVVILYFFGCKLSLKSKFKRKSHE